MRLAFSAFLALLITGIFTLPATAQTWLFETQRAEIAPVHLVDNGVRYEGQPTLSLSGAGRFQADGRWVHQVPVRPGTYYRFVAHFRTRNVEHLDRSVLARLLWKKANGEGIDQPEYPYTLTATEGDWRTLSSIFRAPEGADSARLELVYRWDADGSVWFAPATLTEIPAPAPRIAGLAAVHYRPDRSLGLMPNLEVFGRHIDAAAKAGADIICLPEAVNTASTGKSYVDGSEPIPGPTSRFLGEVARRNGVYIVAGIIERDGDIVYNTSVLIDRQGKIAGKYHKVSLPREEIDGGITPGTTYPVFDTDFGKVGMMICWDVSFPEVARMLARNGAEVILMPIWGGMLDLAEARAIENQVYLVSSTYDMKTGIFDREGKLVAEGTTDHPVAVTRVDLNERTMWPWLGDFRSRINREKPVALP